MSRIWCTLGLALAGLQAQAAELEPKVSAGYSQFGLESLSSHAAYGGAVRIYLIGRLSVEPEVVFLRPVERRDRYGKHFHVNLNPTFDLTRRDRRVVPYVTLGPGYLRFGGVDSLTWSGGAGAKVFVTQRWFIAPEVRAGYGIEPFWRLGAGIGYSFSKRRN